LGGAAAAAAAAAASPCLASPRLALPRPAAAPSKKTPLVFNGAHINK